MTTVARPYGCTSMIRWPAVATLASVPVTVTYVGRDATASFGTVMTVAVAAAAKARALIRSAGRNEESADGRVRSDNSISGAASTATVTPSEPRTASLCRPCRRRSGVNRHSSSRPVGTGKSSGLTDPNACRLETGAVSTAPPSADI